MAPASGPTAPELDRPRPGRAGPPPAEDHRSQRRGRTTDGRCQPRPDHRVQRSRSTIIGRTAARAAGDGIHSSSSLRRYGGDPERPGMPPPGGGREKKKKVPGFWGRGGSNGMFAFAIWERETGRVTLGREPGSASSRSKTLADGPGAPALRLPPCPPSSAPARSDTDVDPVALNHYMSFHAVVPAPHTHLPRRPASCRRAPSGSASRTARMTEEALLDRRLTTAREDDLRLSEDDWRERIPRRPARRGDAPLGRRRAGRRAALGRARFQPDHRPPGRAGAPATSTTFSIGFESVGNEQGTSSPIPTWSRKHFGHPAPTSCSSTVERCCRRCRIASPR